MPNQVGTVVARARIDNNADQVLFGNIIRECKPILTRFSSLKLLAQTLVLEEGVDILLNKVQTIDLNERSYFVGNIAVKKVIGAAQVIQLKYFRNLRSEVLEYNPWQCHHYKGARVV